MLTITAFDFAQLVRPVVVKESVFGRLRRVAEAPTDIKAEVLAVHNRSAVAPHPLMLVRPHTPAPVEQAEAVMYLVGHVVNSALAVNDKAVFLVIEVKLIGFCKRRGNYHFILKGRHVC